MPSDSENSIADVASTKKNILTCWITPSLTGLFFIGILFALTQGTLPSRLLGDAGIVDVSVLMGWFTAVSMTLIAYDVPANAVGLDQ